jgi:hypothetical protein
VAAFLEDLLVRRFHRVYEQIIRALIGLSAVLVVNSAACC